MEENLYMNKLLSHWQALSPCFPTVGKAKQASRTVGEMGAIAVGQHAQLLVLGLQNHSGVIWEGLMFDVLYLRIIELGFACIVTALLW